MPWNRVFSLNTHLEECAASGPKPPFSHPCVDVRFKHSTTSVTKLAYQPQNLPSLPNGSDNIGSVDLIHTCRQEKLFQPVESITPLGAVSEERPLPRSSKRDEE